LELRYLNFEPGGRLLFTIDIRINLNYSMTALSTLVLRFRPCFAVYLRGTPTNL